MQYSTTYTIADFFGDNYEAVDLSLTYSENMWQTFEAYNELSSEAKGCLNIELLA